MAAPGAEFAWRRQITAGPIVIGSTVRAGKLVGNPTGVRRKDDTSEEVRRGNGTVLPSAGRHQSGSALEDLSECACNLLYLL
jgi:hypothetical protein